MTKNDNSPIDTDNLTDKVAGISTTRSSDVKKPKPFFNLNPHAYSTQMKEYNQWIFSQLKKNPDGTWSKPPCNASGYYTDGTDENNWLSFEKAFEICKANPDKFFGIGFSVSSACPYRAQNQSWPRGFVS